MCVHLCVVFYMCISRDQVYGVPLCVSMFMWVYVCLCSCDHVAGVQVSVYVCVSACGRYMCMCGVFESM